MLHSVCATCDSAAPCEQCPCVQDSRMFFAHTLFRVITPFREVTWSDFLLADVLTSLAKPLSDAERAVCHLLTGPVMLPASTAQVGSAPTSAVRLRWSAGQA